MTSRRRIPTRERVALFAREGGRCHLCGGLVSVGQKWDLSHEVPLALGGADDTSNWRVAHAACHRAHTAATDVPNIARAKRREAAHIGAAAPPSRPLRGKGFPSSRKRKQHPVRPPAPRQLYETVR